MNLLEQFGVEPVLLIAQIVNFLIVFFILKKFLYQPILTTLRDREKTIKDGLQQAEEARIMHEKAQEKEKEILKKAQAESKKMIEDARTQSATQLAAAEESTRKTVEKMLVEAREQIAEDSEKARKQLNAQIVHLAEEVLTTSLTGFFDKKDQETVMKNVEKRIKQNVD